MSNLTVVQTGVTLKITGVTDQSIFISFEVLVAVEAAVKAKSKGLSIVITFVATLITCAWKKCVHSLKQAIFPTTNPCHAVNVAVFVSIVTVPASVTVFNVLQKKTSTISVV